MSGIPPELPLPPRGGGLGWGRLAHPRAPLAILALGMILALPALSVGFFSDDYPLLGYLEHRFAYDPPWWDLYRFTPGSAELARAMRESGSLPWWSAPDLHLHLVRPLPSVLLTLDHAAFGHAPLGWHVHSLLWYVVLLACASALFRRLLPPATASLAALVYALSDINVFPFAWPSARYGLLVAAFSAVGIGAHVRRRRDGWEPGRWVAPLAIGVAMTCGEGALGAVAFAVAYDLLAPAPDGASGTVRVRLGRSLPMAILGLFYLVLYVLVGGGARQSGAYVAPFPRPGAFLSVAAVRLPVLVADAILGAPAEFSTLGVAVPMAIAGGTAIVLLALSWRAVGPRLEPAERAAGGWLALGAVAAMATGVGGFPGGRENIVANLGVAPLLAIVIRHGFEGGRLAFARRAGASVLVAAHLVLGPLVQLGNVHTMTTIARATEATAGDIERQIGSSRRAFLLAASDPMVSMYAPAVLAVDGDVRRECWGWISGSRQDVDVVRTGLRSFVLQPREGPLVRTAFEELFRDPSLAFDVGDAFPICGATVRVAAVSEGRPASLEVTAPEDLDAPSIPWLAWDSGALRRVSFPPVGQRRTIRWTPGPSGIF